MIFGKGINDMPRGWRLETEINKRIYRCWHGMLKRCYSEKWHEIHPTYKECFVCERWLKLSNFIEDLHKIDNYELWLINNNYQLDKDIKSNGKNKCYCLDECMFTTQEENVRQANKTRDDMSKAKSEETKHNMSKAKKGEKNPMYGKHRYGKDAPNLGSLIERWNKDGELLDIKYQFEYVQMGFNSGNISLCCSNKQKSHKGYIFKYHKK